MVSCLQCGSKSLVLYTEDVKAYEQKVTSKSTIEKRRKLKVTESLSPQHIECKDCMERFDYVLDDKGKITKLI